uniref:Placenta-specific gene 8 protein-like n=1 Tax=Oreochromis niloticus TaxID=8128 RepID=A0A669EE78_ORENI
MPVLVRSLRSFSCHFWGLRRFRHVTTLVMHFCFSGCYGFWCGPCLASTVAGRFGENSCLPLCDTCCSGGLAVCGIPVCVPPAVLSVRAAMRNRYGIKGSLCKDIAISYCCATCSWCQMHRELKHRKQAPTVVNIQNNNIVNMQPFPVMQAPMMMPSQPVPAAYMAQPGVAVVSQ